MACRGCGVRFSRIDTFVAVKVLKPRRRLGEGDFKRLASVMSRMRPKHRLLSTAWVFLPDHGHAIIYPALPTDPFPSDEGKVAQTSCSSKSAAFSGDEPQSFSKSKLCATRTSSREARF